VTFELKVISSTTTVSLSVSQKYSIYNVQSQLQWSDVTCEQLFLLSYLTRMTVIWCWARPVSSS